jgi:hypothetical protein
LIRIFGQGWDLGFFKQSGTLKSPTLAQSLFCFSRKVLVLFSSKYFIVESDREAVFD